MTGEQAHLEAWLTALGQVTGWTWHSYDGPYDEQGKLVEPTAPFGRATVTRTTEGSTRQAGGRATREWMLTTRIVAVSEVQARWARDRIFDRLADRTLPALQSSALRLTVASEEPQRVEGLVEAFDEWGYRAPLSIPQP